MVVYNTKFAKIIDRMLNFVKMLFNSKGLFKVIINATQIRQISSFADKFKNTLKYILQYIYHVIKNK